jgi:hypothetical protein
MLRGMNTPDNAGAVALRAWLKGRSMTPTGFARENNFHARSVLGWMRGENMPRIDAAADIERITEGAVPVLAWAERTVRRG